MTQPTQARIEAAALLNTIEQLLMQKDHKEAEFILARALAAAQVGEPMKPKQTQDEKAIVRLAETLADRQRKLEALTGIHNFAFEDADQLIAATIERCAQVVERYAVNIGKIAFTIASEIRNLKDAP